MQVTQQDIADAVVANGLAGAPLCVHSSLSSFGCVAGGARAVIDGLLDAGCTVMVPAFTQTFAGAPPPYQRPARNAWDYGDNRGLPEEPFEVYSPDSTDVSKDMGAIAAAVVDTLGRSRGNHPSNSFAAVGPLADELIAGQRPLDVYAPFKELARVGGHVVMMGVDLRTMTAVHLAEQMAGRVLFRRWAGDRDGNTMQAEGGGCSRGFNSLAPTLRPIERRATVGSSSWRIFPMATMLERASAAIRKQPEITRCDGTDCERCRDGIAGGPVLDAIETA